MERMVVVGGCGHVGLPFGISFALAGLDVDLLDTNSHVSQRVGSGVMPFNEEGGEASLKKALASGKLHTERHHTWPGTMRFYGIVEGAEHVVITIGTPVDGYGNPRMGPLLNLMGDLLPFLKNGQHVMLRSTVFPGTTMRLRRLLDEAGLPDVLLTFCPERIVQGHALRELKELPQIVSGTTPEAVSRAAWLFTMLGPKVETISCGVAEAELAKLFCNSWRYIKFAAANQFYELATALGTSWKGVFDAMTTGYSRMRDFPGPGLAAGPCLLKDTQQLAAAFPGRFSLGEAARQVNEGMPELIAKQVDAAVENLSWKASGGVKVRDYTVGILGMTFKAGSDDTRDSLSFKLKKILEWRGYGIFFSDEYASIAGATTTTNVLANSDVVVIAVPHQAYVGISSTFSLSTQREQVVINPWS